MINFSGDDDGNSNNGNNYKMMENYETCSSSNIFFRNIWDARVPSICQNIILLCYLVDPL